MTKTNTALYAQAVEEWAAKHMVDGHEERTFGREVKELLRGIFRGARPLIKMCTSVGAQVCEALTPFLSLESERIPPKPVGRQTSRNSQDNIIAHRSAGTRAYTDKIGLALRLAFSLFTCYGDVVTDGLMTVEMFQRGRSELGQYSLLAMGAHMVFQIGLIFSYGPTDTKARAWEMFLVIFQLKPAVDSYRVLFDSPLGGGQKVPHAETLAASRACEVSTESFPESILQVTFLIDNPREASALNLASVSCDRREDSPKRKRMRDSPRPRRTHPSLQSCPCV